ncbi:putative 3-alpha--hydroxysteroid dehydrogenase [Hyaloraphidium curvatum]|nr:putative 3-alpha--hydroxysteroid dehydrogenase [Hyaloraphidium curvatum]
MPPSDAAPASSAAHARAAPAPEEYPRGARLAGKVALISGASRGLGASHARAIVAQGGKVVIADVAACDDAGKALAAELGRDSAEYVTLDVRDREAWKAAVKRAVERFGKLNVLVLNAGIVNYGTVDVYPYRQWDEVIDVNLTGVFNGLRAAAGALKAGAPSSVVVVSSVCGLQGYAANPGYVAAKWGVRGLAKSAALALAQFGVRVNSLHPGMIESPMTEGLPRVQKHVAMKRAGKAHELSKMVVFLASDESSYSTGAEFVADGGETAGLAMDWNL